MATYDKDYEERKKKLLQKLGANSTSGSTNTTTSSSSTTTPTNTTTSANAAYEERKQSLLKQLEAKKTEKPVEKPKPKEQPKPAPQPSFMDKAKGFFTKVVDSADQALRGKNKSVVTPQERISSIQQDSARIQKKPIAPAPIDSGNRIYDLFPKEAGSSAQLTPEAKLEADRRMAKIPGVQSAGEVTDSLIAGTGDVYSGTGKILKWQGIDGLGDQLIKKGGELQTFMPDTKEFEGGLEFKDAWNPRLYTTMVARGSAFTLAMLPLSIIGGEAGLAVAGARGLGKIATIILSAVGSNALATPFEAATEAGSVYDEMIASGKTKEEANKAAKKAFAGNSLVLALSNTLQFIPFVRTAGKTTDVVADTAKTTSRAAKVAKTVTKAGAVATEEFALEGSEEVTQKQISLWSKDKPFDLTSKDTQTEFVLGGLQGLVFTVGGAIIDTNTGKDVTKEVTEIGIEQSKQTMNEILTRVVAEVPGVAEEVSKLTAAGVDINTATVQVLEKEADKNKAQITAIAKEVISDKVIQEQEMNKKTQENQDEEVATDGVSKEELLRRQSLTKRGIDWQTGKPMEKTASTKEGSFSIVEKNSDGSTTGNTKTVEFPTEQAMSETTAKRDELKAQGSGYVTSKDQIVVKIGDKQIETIPYAKAVEKYGTTDPQLLAERIVNPHEGYNYQTEKYNQATKQDESATRTSTLPKGAQFVMPEEVSQMGRIKTSEIDTVYARIPDGTTSPDGYVEKRGDKLFPTKKATPEILKNSLVDLNPDGSIKESFVLTRMSFTEDVALRSGEKEVQDKQRAIEDYVDRKGTKFRLDEGKSDIIIKEDLTTKFLEHPDVKGKEFTSYSFLINLNKSTAIPLKRSERQIVERVLDTHFKDSKKVNMEDFRRLVVGELMPLEAIRSSTYAGYGSDNVQLGDATTRTYILNSPYDHGQTGHFPSDFNKRLKLDEVEIREIPPSENNPRAKFAVVNKNVQLNEDNIEANVFNLANTKKEAQDWIDTHTSTLGGAGGEQVIEANKINGLFSHFRSFDTEMDGDMISHIAEVQSDAFQKLERIGAGRRSGVAALIERKKQENILLLKNIEEAESRDDMIYDLKIWKADLESNNKEIEGYEAELKETEQQDGVKEAKQFLDYKNIWHERTTREAINIKAKEGATVIRFPTPRTVALIEGFISSDEDNLAPYEVLSGDSENLEAGDTIDYGGDEYTVIKADNYEITVALSSGVTNFDYDTARDEDIDNKWDEAVYEFNNLEKDFGTIDTPEKAAGVIEKVAILDKLIKFNNKAKDIKTEKGRHAEDKEIKDKKEGIENNKKSVETYERFKKLLKGGVVKKEGITEVTILDLAFKDALEAKYDIPHSYWNYLIPSRGLALNTATVKQAIESADKAIETDSGYIDRLQREIDDLNQRYEARVKVIEDRTSPTAAEIKSIPKSVIESNKNNSYGYSLDYGVERVLEDMSNSDMDTVGLDDFEQAFKDREYEDYEPDFEGIYGEGNVFYEETRSGDTQVWITENAPETFNQPGEYEEAQSIEDFDINNFSGTERTVLEFYNKQLIPYIKKIRKDLTLIIDEYDNEWYETQVTPDDLKAPTAFRLKDDLQSVGIEITNEQEQEILDLNSKIFGDTNVKIVGQIFANQKALGSYSEKIIEIMAGQANPTDTFYHEAVHKYLDVFTERSEYIEILKEAQAKYQLDDLAAVEERLAEDFIGYVNKTKTITGRLKIYFDRVISRMKAYMGNEDKINKLYTDILAGKAASKSESGSTRSNRNPFSDLENLTKNLEKKKLNIIEFPEVVRMAEELMGGNRPVVTGSKRGKYLGYFRPMGNGAIVLKAELFKTPGQAAKTLSHEVGHLMDYLPDKTMARGNIIGRLASLRRFMKDSFSDNATEEKIDALETKAERLREARRELKDEDGKVPEADKVKDQSLLAQLKPLNAQVKELNKNAFKNSEVRDELLNLSAKWRPVNGGTGTAVDIQGDDYRASSPELYADAISVLFNDPVRLQNEAPKFFEAFFKFLDQKPKVSEEFFRLQKMLDGDPEVIFQERDKAMTEAFSKAEEKFTAVHLEKQKRKTSLWTQARILFDNKNQAMIDKVKQAQKNGVKIEDSKNPMYEMAGLNYLDGKLKNYINDTFEPVFAKAQEAPDGWVTLGKVLQLERAIYERGTMANPGGYDPKTAQDQLNALEKYTDPKDWAKIQEAKRLFREAVQASVDEAAQAGYYSPELIAQMKANPAYAAFQVVDYLDTFVSAKVYKSVGTLKDIANPATSTVMKMISMMKAIERNKVKVDSIDLLVEAFPDEVQPAKTVFNGKSQEFVDPKDPDQGMVITIRNGKAVAHYVDKHIAGTMNYVSNDTLRMASTIMRRISLSSFYRPLFTSLNLGFQTFNFVRDFQRYWKNVPDYTFGQAITSLPRAGIRYAQAVPSAFARTLGKDDPLITEMENAKMLGMQYNDIFRDPIDPEDKQIERVLQGVGILAKSKKRGIFTPIFKVLEGIELMGNFIESLPKVAGYIELKGKMPQEELANFIRTKVGSPDFRTSGTFSPVTNNVFLFSNAIKEGIKSDIEVATGRAGKQSQSGFLWKTAVGTLLPKMIMAGMLAGLAGDWLKDRMKDVSEYDKANYHIIPLGVDENGKTIYLRVPQDETSRVIGAIWWKAQKALTTKEAGIEDVMDIVSVAGGQLPSVTPAITGIGALLQYMSGQNPYDEFRHRNVIPDREFNAGVKYSLPVFMSWFLQNQGLAVLIPSYIPDNPTKLQKALNFPVVSNIVGRWVKVSDYGRTEELNQIGADIKREQAISNIEQDKIIEKKLEEYNKSGNKSVTGRLKIEAQTFKAVWDSLPKDERSPQKKAALKKEIRLNLVKGKADSNLNALIRATSNDQKAQLLKSMYNEMSIEDYTEILNEAKKNKIISPDVMRKFQKIK